MHPIQHPDKLSVGRGSSRRSPAVIHLEHTAQTQQKCVYKFPGIYSREYLQQRTPDGKKSRAFVLNSRFQRVQILDSLFIMGWFSRTSKPEENTEPSRQNRQKCWETRDSYFECLDRANVVKAGEEGNACTKEKQLYEDNCAKSWVRLRLTVCPFWIRLSTVFLFRLSTSTNGESLPMHKRIVSHGPKCRRTMLNDRIS